MAFVRSILAVSFLVCFIYCAFPVSGVVEIVPPLPGHPVVIEGESINITCVAYDIENKTEPANITFYEVINRYGDTKLVGAGENVKFYSEEKLNGLWLSKTMGIKNMTDALNGRYECHAHRPDDKNPNRTVVAAKYGFSIIYVQRKDLPQLNYSSNVTTEFGNSASLYCQLIHVNKQVSSNTVKLNKIAWFKNDQLRDEVIHLEDQKLGDINLKMESPSDAGKYTCRLFTTLGLTREYSIDGTIFVKIKPRFQAISENSVGDDGYQITLDENEIIRKKGESARFNCGAEGNPITVVWKKTSKSGVVEVLNNTASKNSSNPQYKFSDDNKRFKGFWLEIPDTCYFDRGEYQCCIDNSHGNATEQCQTFTLRVKDPLGWLWPLIGIIIQAILIVLILVIASCCKTGATKNKTVKQTDLSYTFMDDGAAKGHIRLRNTGARTG